MPRQLKVRTNELGVLDVYLIYEYAGVWEPEWRLLQDVPSFRAQLSYVSKEAMDQALSGWTRPFVNALGPTPKGLLLALPKVTRDCVRRDKCPFYRKKDCTPLAKAMQWCFVPEGVQAESSERAAECIRLWREGVYIVVVQEP